jgi:hypothetical protein
MADKGYDPKKAATWNQLIKQGLSVEEAGNQAGIPDDERGNYVVGEDGTIGTWNAGWGESPIGAFRPGEAETDPDFVTRVPYNVKAKDLPSSRTSDDYTDTSTEQYSGKQVVIIATKPQDNAASRALQPAIDANRDALAQFNKDNPNAVTRKRLGLPKMSAAEQAAYNQQYVALRQERADLIGEQNDLKTPGEEARFETPNTTNNTVTTTFGTESTNAPVESADPALAQQEELQAALAGDQVLVEEPAPVQETDTTFTDTRPPIAAPINVDVDEENNNAAGIESVQNDEPAPVDTPLLTPEQSIAQAQGVPLDVPVDDPAAAAADFNANTSTSVLGAIGVKAPAPVAPGPDSPFGGGAANRAAAQNPAAVAAAAQAAQEAQLKQQAAVQAEFQSPGNNDWRVKLKLAPNATYLYKDTDVKDSILAPLAASNGVVFPYMPTIQTSYNAEYDSTDLTHSNYRGQFYKSSFVGDIQITGVFTAQDTAEANYLLAVIHFFRSVTKMFYGARDPLRGAPPPLVYLIGLGQYQFNDQPCVVKSFNYSMPNDCDYIRTKPNNYNVNLGNRQTKTNTGPSNPIAAVIDRLRNAGLKKGALPNVPSQSLLDTQSVYNIDNSTYVPTKCEVSITLMPIQTRDQQSKLFNMQDYASGKLLKGGFW